MEIIELSQNPEWTEKGINYFWKCWGNDSNFTFYEDCISHSLNATIDLPKFYLALEGDEIIGSYALLTNDLISRQDLMPWFACLFVNEEFRKKGIAEKLLAHGLDQAAKKGFNNLYLSSDLENFYERKGWRLFGHGYGVSGGQIKIYTKETHALED